MGAEPIHAAGTQAGCGDGDAGGAGCGDGDAGGANLAGTGTGTREACPQDA